MEGKLIDLATQIATQQAYVQWVLWLTLLGLVVVGWYVKRSLSGYATEVAAIKAQTDKLDDIKKNLAETTRIAKEIEAEVGQKDWRERERLTLYRTRLEDYLTALYNVWAEWSRRYSSMLNDEFPISDDGPSHRVQAIAALYFRDDLRPLTLTLARKTPAFKAATGNVRYAFKARASELQRNAAADPATREEIIQRHNAAHEKLVKEVGAQYSELLILHTNMRKLR